MERKNIKRAREIEEALDVIAKARETAPSNESELEDYWCSISKHKDGSGWRMDLTGARMAKKVVSAIHALLDEEETLLTKELEAL